MNGSENINYYRMIQSQREWHIHSGYGWPGKPITAPASTRYPNILAELGWGSPWLYLMAEFSGVSQEIMAAVMEDDEDLSISEGIRLAQYLGVSLGYLFSPELSMVNLSTNKDKTRLRRLEDLMTRAKDLDDDLLRWWKIEWVRDDLQSGKPVTYASWRYACREIEEALERADRRKRKLRSARLADERARNTAQRR